jgi:hypothetical protein
MWFRSGAPKKGKAPMVAIQKLHDFFAGKRNGSWQGQEPGAARVVEVFAT